MLLSFTEGVRNADASELRRHHLVDLLVQRAFPTVKDPRVLLESAALLRGRAETGKSGISQCMCAPMLLDQRPINRVDGVQLLVFASSEAGLEDLVDLRVHVDAVGDAHCLF